jgi:penicillin-binding protein 2
MFRWPWQKRRRYERREKDIDPDEIFIDSENLPNFDTDQFEGRLEKPISQQSIFIFSGVIVLIFIIFIVRIVNLQLVNGEKYFSKSENNRLRNSLVFSKRGVIYDRNKTILAWNAENVADKAYDLRKYISLDGFAHLLGYLKYPSKDKYGFYYSEVFDGKDGVEKIYNDILSGENGKRIVEVDALGNIQSENIIRKPQDGQNLTLSIDSGIQNKMYLEIKSLAERAGFSGGAGVIMDVNSGEVLTMTSYPEYNSQILTDGQDTSAIKKYFNDKNKPSLNRVTGGLYTPGSTVKPFMAFAALSEKIIDPYTNILSTGSISIPNPYEPTKPTVFKDWKVHGYVDMKRALAVSSDVYFYEVGGGFEQQKGLGIANIDKYMKMFGFGSAVPVTLSSSTDKTSSVFYGPAGNIPTPEWKKETFPSDPDWRVGNTYHTSIGQYGFLVSPMQLVRAVSSLANGGKLLTPKILLSNDNSTNDNVVNLNLDPYNLRIIKDGMRDGVIKDYGVARGLNSENYSVAAKTGTAELGVYKQFVNSWISGFFPYENPKYAFVVIMEKGPVANTTGALSVMRQVLDYMAVNKVEYLK